MPSTMVNNIMASRHSTPSKRRVPSPKPLNQEYERRPPRPDLILCCEGQNTEPHYLEAFAAKHRVALKRNVHIFAPCGVPESVLKCALDQKKAKNYEYRKSKQDFTIWVVIDMDEHANIMPDLLKRAEEAGIHVALSNPCIEIWALYHFNSPPTAAIHRYEAQSQLEKIMTGYQKDKGKLFDFEQMEPGYEQACKIAKHTLEQAEKEGTRLPNPSSNLYELLEAIRAMGRPIPKPITTR